MSIKIKDQIYLTRKEAAKYINSTIGTLAVWDCLKRYNLNPTKIAGRVYYPITYLNKHLEQALIS